MLKMAAAVAFLSCALSLTAQNVTIGRIPNSLSSRVVQAGGPPATTINLYDTATADGTVNKATVYWNGTCTNAFKITFLRPLGHVPTAFTVVATRGPFSATIGQNNVTLSPPVSLLQGDLIGVVQLQSVAACSSIQQEVGGVGYVALTNIDVSVTGALGTISSFVGGTSIAAVAYNSDPVLVRILPAAGAVQGLNAFFRTSLQMVNSSNLPLTGKLVFHPAAQTASPSDPSLAFSIGSEKNLTYPDVVTAIGGSGLGSLDILTDGGIAPIITARVFSDSAAGTLGFTEEPVPANDMLSTFLPGWLLVPADTTNYRMNVGVRTREAGATLSVVTVSADGGLLSQRNGVVYPPNFFKQERAEDFAGIAALPPGGYLFIRLSAGNAVVYGTVTDNRTSDSSMQSALRVHH